MSKTIQASCQKFHDGLSQAQDQLKSFTDEFEARLENITVKLDTLSRISGDLRLSSSTPMLDALLKSETEAWLKAIATFQHKIQENMKGREFQNRFEKQALVIVFGVVKAGKSTLGNFIRGRDFLAAPFDNVYKDPAKMPVKKIKVEESGRRHELGIKEKDWLDQASIESTCSIQYFELPGMVWVDTPGFGAIEKKQEDLRPLAELANQYVQYSDLVVFLANSANPGIREDLNGLKLLETGGKRTLVVITRSDDCANDVFREDGCVKIKKRLIPKSADNRKAQEAYLMQEIKKLGIKGVHGAAVSISVHMAEAGIKKQDDQLWEGSNIPQLYENIISVISNPTILELKKSSPRKSLNNLIQEIVSGGDEGVGGLEGLVAKLKDLQTRIQRNYDQLSPAGPLVCSIVEDVTDKLRGEVHKCVEELAAKRAESVQNQHVSLEAIQDRLSKICMKTLNRHVSNLIGEFQRETHLSLQDVSSTIVRQKEVQSYQVTIAYKTSRSPSGVIETVLGWLGKKYYEASSYTETRTVDVDLGFNTAMAKKELLSKLEPKIVAFTKQELAAIREEFFAAFLKNMAVMERHIEEIHGDLLKMRYL
jgi:hypothetical protein